MKLPGEITKWNIKPMTILRTNSFYNSTNEKHLNFQYMLDSPILRDTKNSSLGFISQMNLWYIDVVPVYDYIDKVCKKYNKPMCRQGTVLGRNNRFVFIAGFTNIEGAGYLCLNNYDKQKEFCNIDNYFGLNNIINLLNFQIL